MTIEQLNKARIPVVRIDEKLERFYGKVLFPEKLEQANNTLAKVGLPTLPKSRNNIVTNSSVGNMANNGK